MKKPERGLERSVFTRAAVLDSQEPGDENTFFYFAWSQKKQPILGCKTFARRFRRGFRSFRKVFHSVATFSYGRLSF